MKNHNKPLVSVIIPAFNAQKYIEQALQSIFDQHYQPLEIIVINDGSTDNTQRIVQSYKHIVCIDQPNFGVGFARQKGLDIAKGELIAFLDADDLWNKQKLELQVNYLLENEDIDIVNAKMRNFIEPEQNYPVNKIHPHTLKGHENLVLGTLLIRTAIMRRIGGFNPNLTCGEDLDWFIRMQRSEVRVHCLPEILLLRRLHNESLTFNSKRAQQSVLEVIIQNRKAKKS